MSFTIHYITVDWELRTSCLQTQFLTCAFLKKVEETSSAVALSPELTVMKEIEFYLSAPNLDIESDQKPLNWWKVNRMLYPTLAKLCVKIILHLCN